MRASEVEALPAPVIGRKRSYGVLLISVAAFAAIWPTWPPLARVWIDSDDYRHGPLVALICVTWLVRRALNTKFVPPVPRASWLPALLLAGLLCLWLIAFKANVESGKQAVAPLILLAAVATAAGWRAAGTVAAPILYLYFAIPIWELAVPLLQSMTVAASRAALGLGGVPVRIEGTLITIPEGSFIVQEACSGKRYLIVALAFGTLLSALNAIPPRQACGYLAICAGCAVVLNWIRVIVIIVAGHVTNMQHYLITHEHLSLGTGIFAVLLAVVWLAGHRMRGPIARPAAKEESVATNAGWMTGNLAISLLLLCVPPLVSAYTANVESRRHAQLPAPATAPLASLGWRGPLPPSSSWAPQYAGATAQGREAFASPAGDTVETFWATYATQSSDVELIHYSNRLVGKSWALMTTDRSVRTLASGRTLSVSTLLAQSPRGPRWLLDYRYVVDGVSTSHDWMAQLLYGSRSWTHPAPASVQVAAVNCLGSCEQAERVLAQYWLTQSK